MNVQVYQFYVEPQSPSKNETKIKKLIAENIQDETEVIVLPEMWNNGYALQALKEHADNQLQRSFQFIKSLALHYNVDIIAGSVSNREDENIFNTAFAVNRHGEKIYEYHKIHLVPMLNEPDYLNAGHNVPYMFELSDGTPVSQIICYDLRFPELTRYPAASGAKVMFYVAQWPEVRLNHWRKLLQARAIENNMYVIAANTCGSDDNTLFAGHSLVINPNGDIIAEANQVETVLNVKLNLNEVDEQRKKIPVFDNLRPDVYQHFTK